jgi:histidine ammonia-lyase
VHGASKRAINDATRSIDEEMRSSGDNPIIVPVGDDDGIAISGANFDGTFVGMAADMLCIAQANLAKISERRTDRLVNSHFSELPPFLVRQPGLNSGYMIVQYTAAGLMGEMKILSHPATVDSVPTCGNQEDPVSFAYNAARKAYAIAGKLDYVLALELMVACQALDFFDPTEAAPATKAVYDLIRAEVPTLIEDRWLHPDIEFITDRVRDGRIVAAVEALVGDLG